MITIIYSTHKDSDYNNKFRQHLLQTVGLKNVQILEYQNNNEYSLAEIYNKGISESINDIIVCCHNDIKLENGWGKKLLKDFDENPDYGIIGKAGSCYFPKSGIYWEKINLTMVGQVYHQPKGHKKWLSSYSPKSPFLIPVVTIDGLFISFDRNKIIHKFDESIGKFHFYDHSFCVPNYLDNIKIGVTSSFEITHESIGQPNQEFYESKDKFLEKYGTKLPLDLKPKIIYAPKINSINTKKIGKIAIIIPTKGKLNLLFDCINSFFDHCNNEIFDIFIAHTGSEDEEKIQIKEYIKDKKNICQIEYTYYNFGKINNDVVKNHLNDNYEFLVFCNNDIKILNDVLSGMLKIFKENPRTGTVGCRLHFKDNTIQHGGIVSLIDKQNRIQFTHISLFGYYNFINNKSEVVGSTAALLMIRKNVFEKIGGFNENYNECFEDVELNLECLKLGLSNYFDGRLVAYHYESQTRDNDENKNKKMKNDYVLNLLPYVNKNIDYFKKFLIKI